LTDEGGAPSKIEVAIDAASIETGNAHLRSPDFLDAEQYPVMRFESGQIEALGQKKFTAS